MNFRTLLVIFVLFFTFTVCDKVVFPCSNTGNCRFLTTCVAPSDINSCTVNFNGTNYLCSSPPSMFLSEGPTCKWVTNCENCRSNGRFSVAPECIWKKI